jgi:hypothetical protein
MGASEKCAKTFTGVHMPFTTFPQAPEMCKCRKILAKAEKFVEVESETKAVCPGMVHLRLRKTLVKILTFSIGTMKFIDACRIGSDQQAIFFHQDDRRVERRTLGSVNVVFRATYAVFVEVQQ